jgi:hypothetical protein
LEFLLLAAISIAIVHSFAPDHYLPIVTIARMKNWGAGKAAGLSGIAAGIHVATSVILSLAVFTGLDLAGYAKTLEEVSPLMLILFGLLYTLMSVIRPHKHVHSLSTTTLLLVLGLSPCVPLIPIVLATSTFSQAMFVALLFSVATISTIVTLTYISYKAFKPPRIDEKEDVVAGIIVAAVGLIMYILEGKIWISRHQKMLVSIPRMKSLA